MTEIDLNCDVGESFGAYKLGCDEEIIKHVSSANIACGFHAGDPVVMQQTIRLANTYDVKVGAPLAIQTCWALAGGTWPWHLRKWKATLFIKSVPCRLLPESKA